MSAYCRATLIYANGGLPEGVDVDVEDGRTAPLPHWDECGFELMSFPSAVTDWSDDREVADRHFEEVIGFVRKLTGCGAVLFYPPLLRSPARAEDQADLAPIEFVHSDYTEAYRHIIENPDHPYHQILKPSMVRAGVTAEDIRSASRILTLQLWRNVGAPDMDYPLCFCDARTVRRDEMTPIRVAEYGGLKTDFDAFAVAPPLDGSHKWYVFPDMTPDEVVLFRAYDSDRAASGEPFWTPHVSFRDPTRPPDTPRRVSMEMRAICLFDS